MYRQEPAFYKDGFTMRPARAEDAEEYYAQNYCPLDPEVARLTGCKPAFAREEVVPFFLHCVEAEERRFFLLIAPDGTIAGESVRVRLTGKRAVRIFGLASFLRRRAVRASGHG